MPVEPVRVWNPPSPYLTEHRELIGEPPAAELEVYEDTSQSILSTNDSPDIGFRFSVNPYRGCHHACAYCISGDTPIAMANGRTKPIANIRVGDEVYGTHLSGTYRHGRYRRFVRTHILAHGCVVKPAYRVVLEDGTQLITSADHRLLSHRGWKWVTGTEQGRTRRPHLTMKNKLIGTGNFASPPEEDTEYQRGYLCGMIRGDGLLGTYNYNGRRRTNEIIHQFRLALIDLEALERAQRYLYRFEVPTREFLFQGAVATRQAVHGIRTSARSHVDRVRGLIQWPLEMNMNWHKGFLAGIFDAEGSYSRGVLRICNTDGAIIDCITDGLRRLNFDYAVERRTVYKSDRPIYVVRIRGGLREHLRFFHTVGPAITRKMDIVGQAIKNRTHLRVCAIEALGVSLPMYDVTTGTGDFIANGVISHNCYARPTHEYFGLGAGTDFERKIFVKRNAPQLLEQAFQRRSWKGERIVFSGVTDCYQPLEAAWELTRGCLAVCLKYRNPVGIITKSALIRRDVEILKGLAREVSVNVSLSIAFLDEETVRLVEPGAPSIRKRFETMEILASAGIPVGIGVAPIIPGLNDRDIPGLLKEAKRRGATSAFRTLLRLPGSVREVFLHRIAEKMPLKAEHIRKRILDVRDGKMYDSRFGHRHSGTGAYWEAVDRAWDVWTERLGFNEEEEEPQRLATFHRSADRKGQAEFQWA